MRRLIVALLLLLTACGVEPEDEPVPVTRVSTPTTPHVTETRCPPPP